MKQSPNKAAADALAAMMGEAPQVGAPAEPEVESAAAPVDSSRLGRVRESDRGMSTTQRSLRNKRTLIPIMLTLGVLLPAIATLKWILAEDSPFAALPLGAVMALLAIGAVLQALAILNMLHVRHLLQLTQTRRPS